MKVLNEDTFESRITTDPEVNHGKPSIRNLRYPVALILALLDSGMSPQEIVGDYPDLELEDIRAAQDYGGKHG